MAIAGESCESLHDAMAVIVSHSYAMPDFVHPHAEECSGLRNSSDSCVSRLFGEFGMKVTHLSGEREVRKYNLFLRSVRRYV